MTESSKKKVGDEAFWKVRIDHFKPTGLHRTVYNTSDSDMARIDAVHKELLKKYEVSGLILDAGCGYGRNSQWFDKKDYIGVDFSPDFIQLAQERNPQNTFAIGDIKELQFNDKAFDWAICISIKRMVVANLGWEVWGKMEDELRRVARNILILEYSTPTEHEVIYTI